MSRLLLRRFLEPEGFAVREADDGSDGLDMYADHGADLIFVDIFMPRKDGLETIRELVRLAPGCPIVAITDGGHLGRADLLVWARGFGAHGALAKPLAKAEAVDAVRQFMAN